MAETSVTLSKSEIGGSVATSGTEQPDMGLTGIMLSSARADVERRNVYISKRNIIHQLIDVALLMANVSQLKTALEIDVTDKYFYPLLIFISLSITLQLAFTVCMLVAWSAEKHETDEADATSRGQGVDEVDGARKRRVACLDRTGDILVLLIIVLNVLITGFGVESHN